MSHFVYIIEELKYLKLGPNFITVYEEIDEHTGLWFDSLTGTV